MRRDTADRPHSPPLRGPHNKTLFIFSQNFWKPKYSHLFAPEPLISLRYAVTCNDTESTWIWWYCGYFTDVAPVSGLPPQHLYYSHPDHHPSPSGPKYGHENGGPGAQDNFSDFVSLVCQDGPPGPSRSPKVSVAGGYYSPGMYPPPPPPPMTRPVPLVRSADHASVSPPVPGSPAPHGHPEHHMTTAYDGLMPGNLIPPSDGHHPPPHDGEPLYNSMSILKSFIKYKTCHVIAITATFDPRLFLARMPGTSFQCILSWGFIQFSLVTLLSSDRY